MQDDEQFEIQGGSLEKSLNGEVKLDFKLLVKEAWELSKNTKTPVLQGMLMLFFIAIFFTWILQSVLGFSDLNSVPPSTMLALKIAGVVVTTPIIAAIFLIGISHSVGVKPEFFTVLKNVLGSVLVILLALLLAAMSDLGSLLGSQVNIMFGIILLFYVNLATGFAIMLLVEKRLAPSQCIIQSAKVFHKHWQTLLFYYIAYYSFLILGIFSFGFAYIWIVPFFINLKGILYRELFGIKVKRSTSANNSDETVFHA